MIMLVSMLVNSGNFYRKSEFLTCLSGSVDWLVRFHKHHPVSVAKKDPGFLVKLEMAII